ncbi:MAG TPA: UDP-N-acetylglucosamine 2-epimerase (non-hydrolyzing) [Elusimicrobiota bacterium]|nr:UDP-N-acetylglucosamine 2-epimerase (non-hydrolyzing) [Elusimicrobiota bacterium]
MRTRPLSVLVVAGTRPEAVKLAPVLRRLRREPSRFRARFLATGQHRELLDAMLQDLGLRPDADLRVMRRGQSPGDVLARVIAGVEAVLERERPDLVLVQGDTTSVLGAALAAFHRKVPVGHVEAGLRSHDLSQPYPEEINRVIVDQLSTLLFAPTPLARRNLRREGFAPQKIFTTGNTVVDAVRWAAALPGRFREPALRDLPKKKFLVTVTLHRRESFGKPLEGVFRGMMRAVDENPELLLVYPVHPNPAVRSAASRMLKHPRIRLTPPLGYLDFVRLMNLSEAVLTDSGGIQEEAPSLGKTVLVVREKTERPEVLGAGRGQLIGVGEKNVQRALGNLPRRASRKQGSNPFGDGQAADRIVEAILYWAGLRKRRCPDFAT